MPAVQFCLHGCLVITLLPACTVTGFHSGKTKPAAVCMLEIRHCSSSAALHWRQIFTVTPGGIEDHPVRSSNRLCTGSFIVEHAPCLAIPLRGQTRFFMLRHSFLLFTAMSTLAVVPLREDPIPIHLNLHDGKAVNRTGCRNTAQGPCMLLHHPPFF